MSIQGELQLHHDHYRADMNSMILNIQNTLILEWYKYLKMHVRISEIRNVILNILLYPFLHSAKEVEILSSWSLIEPIVKYLKFINFTLMFSFEICVLGNPFFSFLLSRYLLCSHYMLGTKLWNKQ